MIIVSREAIDQGKTSLVKSVDILPHPDLMEVSNLAKESLDKFLASMARFATT